MLIPHRRLLLELQLDVVAEGGEEVVEVGVRKGVHRSCSRRRRCTRVVSSRLHQLIVGGFVPFGRRLWMSNWRCFVARNRERRVRSGRRRWRSECSSLLGRGCRRRSFACHVCGSRGTQPADEEAEKGECGRARRCGARRRCRLSLSGTSGRGVWLLSSEVGEDRGGPST